MTRPQPGGPSGAGTRPTQAAADGPGADPGQRLRPPLTARLRPGHWVAIDAVIAVLFAVVFVVGAPRPAYGIPMWVAYLLALGATLPAAVRRRWPLAVLTLVVISYAAATALGTGMDLPVAAAFVLYLVPLRFPRRASAVVLAATLAVIAAGIVAGGWAAAHSQAGGVASRLAAAAAVITVGWVIGAAVRAQRAYTAGLAEQEQRRAEARLAEARHAVTEERLRIARELHDVVAHSLSLIAVQAGVGSYVASTQPGEAARALSSIEATSRSALGEMRRLLGVLRNGDPAGSDLGPAPGLADLGQLITRTAGAGMHVQLEVRGAQRPLPPGADLAAYRIVQEALTNVVKHAHSTNSQVVVTYHDDAVSVEITDDGSGAPAAVPASGAGHGITGMRERASLYGGQFHAGPLPGGGFRVTARLPLDSPTGQPTTATDPAQNGSP